MVVGRAVAFVVIRVCLFVFCTFALLDISAPLVLAQDTTSVSTPTGTAQTPTVGGVCDAAPTTQSCLGQRVDFSAIVTNTQSGAPHGAPTGSIYFMDETGAVIGQAALTSVSTTTSSADFKTLILAATPTTPHSITAQYVADISANFKNSSELSALSWTVMSRPTTTAISVTTPAIAGTTEPLSAAVTDAGPAPQAIDQNGNPVSGGSFFLANNGTTPTPIVLTLKTARFGEAGAALPNDTVLIVGGNSGGTTVLATSELIGNTVAYSGSLNTARAFLTATTGKGGGRVFIAGGTGDTCLSATDLGGGTNTVLNSFEIYTISSGTFAPNTTDFLSAARCGHTATRMNDGRILVAGGYDTNGAALQSTEIFDPSQKAGKQVSAGPNLATPRAGAVAVLLQSGSVLIAGGDAAGDAEMCDSLLGACTTISGATMSVPRMFFAGGMMPDGNVLFAGGFNSGDSSETALASTEIYDATTSSFTAIKATLLNSNASGAGPAKNFGSAVVADGFVGFAGGIDNSNAVLGTIQVYAPAYDPEGKLTFTSADNSDNIGGSGTPGPVQCTLDVPNGTRTVACSAGTATTYYARHVDTGSHAITASYLGSSNSAASMFTQAVTVNPTPLTINANNLSKVYGQTFNFVGNEFTLPSPTQLLPGDVVGSVTLTSTGAPMAATYVSPGPSYDINITPNTVVFSSGSAADYAFTYGKGTMTLSPAALTVQANNQSKPYGQTFNFNGTEFTPLGLFNGDTVTSSTISSPGTAVTATFVLPGPAYPINISAAVGTGLGNYNISYTPGTMAILQAPLTLTANPQTKQYGNTFTFVGNEFAQTAGTYYNGDLATGASFSSAGAGPAATVISPGPSYAINIANATGPGVGNYNITYAPGTMALLPAPAPTVTAKNLSKQYGLTFNFLGTEFTATGLLNSDTIASVTLTSPGAAGGATVVSPGPAYPIFPSNATGPALGNYFPIVAYLPGTMTVTLAPLTVTANNQNKVYGDGFVFAGTEFTTGQLYNGDQVTSASMTSVGATPIALFTAGPAYPISISNAVGTGLLNYSISYSPGTMTLTQRPLPITAVSGAKFYGTVPSFAGTQGSLLGQFAVSNLVNGDTVTAVTMSSPGQASNVAVGNYPIVPSNPQGSGLGNYAFGLTAGTLAVTPATPGMRAEQISTKIDQASGGTIITVHVFLFNSNAPGANPGTGAPDVNPPDTATLSTSTIDIFDGTNKLNSSPVSLTKLTTAVPCSSGGQDCGVDATFTTAPLPFTTGSTHSINVAYAANQNFAAKSTAVGSVSVAASNIMGGANIPPMTSKSAPIQIPNPEPLLTGQTYTLTCAIYSVTTGAQMLATSGTCTTSAGSTPTDLSTNPSITVSVSTQVATSELRMRPLYDLSFTMPAFVLVGAGVPLVGLRRRVKRGKPLAWLGITLALVLCLVAVGCGGNGFKNPNNVPVITQNSAQAGQYTIIVTATNTSSGNRFDVASLPFSVSQ